MASEAAEVLAGFWRAMAGNDFEAVARDWFRSDAVIDWPQSGERMGPDAWGRINRDYPAEGPWTFEIRRLVGGSGQAVSEVVVRSVSIRADVISFAEVSGGRIVTLREWWPERYPAPGARASEVQAMPERDR